MKYFVGTAACTMLEGYLELLCASLSLDRLAGNIPPFVNYKAAFC